MRPRDRTPPGMGRCPRDDANGGQSGLLAPLGVLATGGGLLVPRAVRRLADDELGRSNLRRAVVVGYWVAMAVALGLYLGPWFRDLAS